VSIYNTILHEIISVLKVNGLSVFSQEQMTFDYQYIDPGPDDPGCTVNRYLALKVSIIEFCMYLAVPHNYYSKF
jgi:hypothetical protein